MIIVKKPKIRFKGFTETWEQRKLGEVFNERTERAKGNEELLSVTINNGVIRQIDSDKRNIASEDKSNYKIVQIGDVPYNSMRMWQGAVGNSEYNGIVSPAYTVLVPSTNADSKFFVELFKKNSTLNIFQRWSQGLTSDTWNLKYPILSKIEFYMPMIDEQKKIGSLFSKLDNLITLHQRQCENLKKLKKFMLQKLFPQNGENVPEIRFSNFTDTWEQRKFKNIAERLSESYMSDDKNPSVEYEDIISELGTINKDIFNKRIRKNGIKFSNNEILYGKLRPYLHNWLKPDFYGIAVGDWWVLKPINCDREFIFRLIQTSTFDNIANQSNGTKMPRADWNLIANSDFHLPISIYEQKQIGSLFSKLDHLITLHQSKCDKLKEVKKYMLQNMFV